MCRRSGTSTRVPSSTESSVASIASGKGPMDGVQFRVLCHTGGFFTGAKQFSFASFQRKQGAVRRSYHEGAKRPNYYFRRVDFWIL